MSRLAEEIVSAQTEGVRSVVTLNSPQRIEAAVKAICAGRRAGFFGARSSDAFACYFRQGYNMIAPLALVELLLAGLATRGGRKVLHRLADVDARLHASRPCWHEPGHGRRSSPSRRRTPGKVMP